MVELLSIEAAGVLRHVHAHKRHCGAALIVRRILHRGSLRSGKVCRRHAGVHIRLCLLHLLEHLLVLLAGLYAGHAEGDYLKTAQVTPLAGEHLVERLRKLKGMTGQGAVSYAHVGNLCKRGLKRGQKLGLELPLQLVAGVGLAHVAADVCIEEDGVCDTVAVFAEAANGDVNIYARALVNDTEGHGRGSAVLIADKLLGVEIVHALILGCLAAEGKALADVLKGRHQRIAEVAGENRRLGRGIVDKFTGLRAKLDYLALLDDHHALSVGNRDDRAVGDDVVNALVAAPARDSALTLDGHHALGNRLTVKIFSPLVGQYAARCTHCCLNKSHNLLSPYY